ncbi:polysaccharide pyruvyl transferase family protein [Escherichia coli]|nr:polysaccharide pyruvyl transferase family protein [Escherichia coli]
MKLLILGNHTCGNRGDSAILRGLLDAINILNPHAEVDVMSRYPVSSSWLLNRPVMGDPLFLQMKQHNSAAGVVGRVKKVLRRRYQHQVLLSRVTDTGKLRNIAIAQGFTDFVRLLSGYDAIIQVGGSFFVDLYGVPQFEHALCTFMAKKPLFMIGHSVGPFQDEQFNQLANYVFGHCDALILRESVSLGTNETQQYHYRKSRTWGRYRMAGRSPHRRFHRQLCRSTLAGRCRTTENGGNYPARTGTVRQTSRHHSTSV